MQVAPSHEKGLIGVNLSRDTAYLGNNLRVMLKSLFLHLAIDCNGYKCKRVQTLLKIIMSIETLDQGHLHPLLEHWRLTCPGWESNPIFRSGK